MHPGSTALSVIQPVWVLLIKKPPEREGSGGFFTQISVAKGLASIPAQPHVPVAALQPIVNALEEIVKSIESVIDKL